MASNYDERHTYSVLSLHYSCCMTLMKPFRTNMRLLGFPITRSPDHVRSPDCGRPNDAATKMSQTLQSSVNRWLGSLRCLSQTTVRLPVIN